MLDRINQLSQENDRLQAELAHLRESERRYRTLFELSSEGIMRFGYKQPAPVDLSVDEQLDLCYQSIYIAEANDALAQMYGREAGEELIGLTLNDFHDRTSEVTQATMRDWINNRYSCHQLETVELDRHGRKRYFLNSSVSTIENDCVTSTWVSQVDITELREAQQTLLEAEQQRSQELERLNTELQQTLDRLSESEERYRTLFEISSEGIFRFEFDQPIPIHLSVDEQVELMYRDWRLAEANATYAAMYDINNPDDLIGLRLTDVHVMESEQNFTMMRAVAESNYQLRNAETEEVDFDGKPRYFLNNITTTIKDGYAIGGWASQLDITELRLAQQALLEAEQKRSQELERINTQLQQTLDRLAESEKRYRTLFELSNEGIYRFELDPPVSTSLSIDEQVDLIYQNYRYVEVNKSFVSMLGLENVTDAIGKSFADFFKNLETNREGVHTAVVHGYQIRNAQAEEIGANGQRRYILWNTVSELRDGYVCGGWGTQTDITDLKAAQQALLEAEQARVAELAKTNQALKNSLDRLAAEPDLNAFLGHVLLEITQQLQVEECWLQFLAPETGTLHLHMQIKNGQVRQKHEIDDLNPIAQSLPTSSSPIWEILLQTKRPFMMTWDIAADYVFEGTVDWQRKHGYQAGIDILLTLGDKPLGLLVLLSMQQTKFTPEELELAQALAQQATLAIQLTRLAEAAKQAAILEDRNRMAREIHDTLAQSFAGILMQLQAATLNLIDDPEQVIVHLKRASNLTQEGLAEARRSVRLLQQGETAYSDLLTSLHQLAERMGCNTDVPISVNFEGRPYTLNPEVGVHLFRMVQESVNNALRHARPTTIQISLSYSTQKVSLCIQDDGYGFDLEQPTNGFGLKGMQQRADLLNAQLRIDSQIGIGTEVYITAPTHPS